MWLPQRRCTIVTTTKSGRFVQWGQHQHRYDRTSCEMAALLLPDEFERTTSNERAVGIGSLAFRAPEQQVAGGQKTY